MSFKDAVQELIDDLEDLRCDIAGSVNFCTHEEIEKRGRANDMLNDCLWIVNLWYKRQLENFNGDKGE